MSEWQPIDSAPKDREWSSDCPNRQDGIATAYDQESEKPLFLVFWQQCGNAMWETTHWLPLPAPPSAEALDSERAADAERAFHAGEASQ